MKFRDEDGSLKEVIIQANDSIPAGGIIEYDGDTVPEGFEEVEPNFKIKMFEGTTPASSGGLISGGVYTGTEKIIGFQIENFNQWRSGKGTGMLAFVEGSDDIYYLNTEDNNYFDRPIRIYYLDY